MKLREENWGLLLRRLRCGESEAAAAGRPHDQPRAAGEERALVARAGHQDTGTPRLLILILTYLWTPFIAILTTENR